MFSDEDMKVGHTKKHGECGEKEATTWAGIRLSAEEAEEGYQRIGKGVVVFKELLK